MTFRPPEDLITELRKAAQLAGIWGDPKWRRTIENVERIPEAGEREAEAAELIRDLQEIAVIRGAEGHPFLPYPTEDELNHAGEDGLTVGFIDTLGNGEPFPVRLPRENLAVHMLVAGPTGKGKSVFVLNSVLQLITSRIPVWLFDTVGLYADLLPALAEGVTVIRFMDFRRNPFHGPPNISQEQWLEFMANYMREAFFFRDGVINVFREVCARLAEKKAELNARAFVEELPSVPLKTRRIMDYFESLQRFAAALRMKPYQCACGFDLCELSRRPVVFDLTNISNDHRLFFIADLLTWQDAWREYERDRRL